MTTDVTLTPGGALVNVVLDGGALVNWLVAAAFNTPGFKDVPNLIGDLAAGKPAAIAKARAASVAPPGLSGYGLTYGVCSEWIPYERGATPQRTAPFLPGRKRA